MERNEKTQLANLKREQRTFGSKRNDRKVVAHLSLKMRRSWRSVQAGTLGETPGALLLLEGELLVQGLELLLTLAQLLALRLWVQLALRHLQLHDPVADLLHLTIQVHVERLQQMVSENARNLPDLHLWRKRKVNYHGTQAIFPRPAR